MEAIRGKGFFVLYWRCPLIRVSVIRGYIVYGLENTALKKSKLQEHRWCKYVPSE
jgi:hypothetical protein